MTSTTASAGTRDLPHPVCAEIRLEGVLHALSDPMRLRIVRELAAVGSELTCSQFALPVTKSTSTHHFRVLRESGVIHQTYRGTAKMNGLRRTDLDGLFPGLLDALLLAADRETVREAEVAKVAKVSEVSEVSEVTEVSEAAEIGVDGGA